MIGAGVATIIGAYLLIQNNQEAKQMYAWQRNLKAI